MGRLARLEQQGWKGIFSSRWTASCPSCRKVTAFGKCEKCGNRGFALSPDDSQVGCDCGRVWDQRPCEHCGRELGVPDYHFPKSSFGRTILVMVAVMIVIWFVIKVL